MKIKEILFDTQSKDKTCGENVIGNPVLKFLWTSIQFWEKYLVSDDALSNNPPTHPRPQARAAAITVVGAHEDIATATPLPAKVDIICACSKNGTRHIIHEIISFIKNMFIELY